MGMELFGPPSFLVRHLASILINEEEIVCDLFPTIHDIFDILTVECHDMQNIDVQFKLFFYHIFVSLDKWVANTLLSHVFYLLYTWNMYWLLWLIALKHSNSMGHCK